MAKLRGTGVNAFRAASGVLGNDKSTYRLPLTEADVEIVLARLSKSSFTEASKRAPAADTAGALKEFHRYVDEALGKGGWAIFFLDSTASPKELLAIGEQGFGVGKHDGYFVSPDNAKIPGDRPNVTLVADIGFIPYGGSDYAVTDDLEGSIEAAVRRRVHNRYDAARDVGGG